jgi:hypothetical protein
MKVEKIINNVYFCCSYYGVLCAHTSHDTIIYFQQAFKKSNNVRHIKNLLQ